MPKVAIIRRNGFGDLLCSYPLILYFKKYYPQTEITLFAEERNAPLLPYLPHIHKTVVIPSSGNKYLQHLFTALRYRGERFDMAISTKTSPMKLMNFFLYALGAKQRVAPVSNDWHSRLINAPIPFDEVNAKRVHQAVKVLRTVEPSYNSVPEEFFPRIEVKRPYFDHSLEGPLLMLSASTTRPTSRFDPFRYCDILNRIYAKFPFSVIVTGQPKDEPRARAILENLKVPHLLHFPRSFDEFMVWIAMSDCLFVGDGGIAHIAAALGKSQVVLFGETNPVEWAPLSCKTQVFYDPLHVNRLKDEVLEKAVTEMIYGSNSGDFNGRDSCEPFSAKEGVFQPGAR